MKTKLRHTLVQYQGGGYDGCFWEWNFFYIDAEGEFHDIQSSGRAGCSTAEQADKLLAEEANASIDDYDGPPIHTYDITKTDDIETFSSESNAVHVLDVLKWFNWYNDPDIEFFAICTECNENIFEDGTLEDYHGCGGIAMTADALICPDCYSMGTCGCCNEYVGQSGLEFEQDIDDCSENTIELLAEFVEDDGPACQDCWENERNSLIIDEHAELLSTSLATGTPDMFDNDMRWFWGAE